jgi:crotonobetainyl-CoA:carnitine CoA-transferase CaiB-like acyl-CoA transferase
LVSLLALFNDHWSILSDWIVEVTGDERAKDPRYTPSAGVRYQLVEEITPLINALTAHFAADEFCREAQERGVPAMSVNSVAELLSDPHLEATEFWRDVELRPGVTVKWPGPPFTMG